MLLTDTCHHAEQGCRSTEGTTMTAQASMRDQAPPRSPAGGRAQGRRAAARVVVVLRDQNLACATASTLVAHGIDAIAFARPTAALHELQEGASADVLVTSADFQPGLPNGISLAR